MTTRDHGTALLLFLCICRILAGLAAAQHAAPFEATGDAGSSELSGLASIVSAVAAEEETQQPNRQLLGELNLFFEQEALSAWYDAV
jgi:hypothetical protein